MALAEEPTGSVIVGGGRYTERGGGEASTAVLPKDLPGALQRLPDAEVESSLAAVTAEVRRRGLSTKPTPEARPRSAMAAVRNLAGRCAKGARRRKG